MSMSGLWIAARRCSSRSDGADHVADLEFTLLYKSLSRCLAGSKAYQVHRTSTYDDDRFDFSDRLRARRFGWEKTSIYDAREVYPGQALRSGRGNKDRIRTTYSTQVMRVTHRTVDGYYLDRDCSDGQNRMLNEKWKWKWIDLVIRVRYCNTQ